MASLQILKSGSSPFTVSHSNSLRNSCRFCSEFNSRSRSGKAPNFENLWRSKLSICRNFRVSCKLQEDDNQTNSEEPPESLFMKELKRRGMNPTSLLEESKRSIYGDEVKFKEEEGGYSKRNTVSTDYDKSLSNQRERSMALNSEGLEGLIPRAKILLSIGGTFFLVFWPLILITVTFFTALYLYFGPTFVHDGSSTPITPPQYIDPYALLEDERISEIAPRVN